jgi:hypothetical protein
LSSVPYRRGEREYVDITGGEAFLTADFAQLEGRRDDRTGDAPSLTPSLLWATGPWAKKNYGSLGEGDIFAVLSRNEHVVRSFEFAAVDGGIVLEKPEHTLGATYAERFLCLWDHMQSDEPHSRRIIPFDAKSSTGLEAGAQTYYTRSNQHSKTAFFITICASDPNFVSLIPNVPSARREGDTAFAASISKRLPVHGIAYGFLDPETAAHRMPIGLLPTAVERVRECVLTDKDYVNPWTGVAYAGWRPLVVQSFDDFYPDQGTEHYSAFASVLAIWRELRTAGDSRGEAVGFDMIGVQPRLADMKIICRGRQWLIQCKSDVQERQYGQVHRVPIGRNQKEKDDAGNGDESEMQATQRLPSFYFASYDRFVFDVITSERDPRLNVADSTFSTMSSAF